MLERDDRRLDWFRKARFGLFIHWGLYSATEGYWKGKETMGIGEWIQAREKIPCKEYEKFAGKLTCEKFDPVMWAKLAKKAGMKYCVFTAKHHEGFSMYDTSYDEYNIVEKSPYAKDVTRQVIEAFREEGIVPCLYYSQALDFHEENAWGNTWDYSVPEQERDMWSYVNGKCKHQLKELLTGYGKIGMLWMDVPKGLTDEMAVDIRNLVKEYQPDCLISGRITYDNKMGDFGCYGDNQIPAGKAEGCWETAATMNHTWGYKKDDHNYKSPQEIIELLCSLLAKGTNLLLNIGPRPDGSLTEETIFLLKEIGVWHEVNKEAVSGTEGSPFDCDFSFGGISQRDNMLYLYVYEKQESIDIYGIANRVTDISVLGGGSVPFVQKQEGGSGEDQCGCQENVLHIDLRDAGYGKYVTVVKITLDGQPDVKGGLRQQEKAQIILPACSCGIIKKTVNHSGKVNQSDEKKQSDETEEAGGDDALLADIYNTLQEEEIMVNPAGIVKNWYSEKNFLQWEFEVVEEGWYDTYLYTVTQKYQSWTGGHEVHLVYKHESACGIRCESRRLTADREARGANQKYFAETGSFVGTVPLIKGKNTLQLLADHINGDDPVGLSVSKLVLIKKRQ